jgi:hypothetical protein
MLRHARRRMTRDGGPNGIGVMFGDVVAAQKIARGVRTIDLETLILAAVLFHETEVMKHGAPVEQLAIELQAAMDTCACRKSNPNIFVVQSAEDWAAKNTPCPLHGAR